ncbi:MAG: MMPL family transporter [Planctomycetota bacterium]|jgi:hopanoid biosynthesis associated RND transporter like protein HpnN
MSHGRSPVGTAFAVSHVLARLAEFGSDRPGRWITTALLSAVAAAVLTAVFMQFKTDRADLIDPNAEFHRRWLNYTQAFGDASDLVVVVEGDDPEAIKATLEDLGERVAAETALFDRVLFKVEPGNLRRKGLQYLSPQQLEEGLEYLRQFRPVLAGAWRLLKLDSLAERLLIQVQDGADLLATGETEADRIEGQQRLDGSLHHLALLTDSLDTFASESRFKNPWPQPLQVDPTMPIQADQVIYLMNQSGTIGFLKTRAVDSGDDFNGATPSIDRLRELIAIEQSRHRDVRIGLTGIPVLENDEMRRSQADMIRASVLSFFGVGVLLLIGFRGLKHPVLALIMLAVGMAWSFGFTTLAIGHLNILSVSFAAILIGLGIDFAIHYLARYLELRHHGAELRPALSESSATVGTGILTAALTTSLAFFCAGLTEFLGVAELGIIAGAGVLLCAAATFIVLPALVSFADRDLAERLLPTPFQGNVLRRFISRRPLIAFLLSAAIIAIPASFAFELRDGVIHTRVRYDYNLLNLQAEGLESVEIQRRIFHSPTDGDRAEQGSLLYAVSLAKSREEALALREQFLKLPTVHHVEELASRLPRYPASETQLLVQGYEAQLARLPDQVPQTSPVNPDGVGRALDEAISVGRTLRHPLAQQFVASTDRFLDVLAPLDVEQQSALLTEYQQRMIGALLAQFQAVADSADPEPVTRDDLPTELASRFISQDGQWLLQVYPSEPLWDIEPLTRFVNDVRAVDPQVTGTPLQNFEASQQIMGSYQKAALYALIAVSLVLLIDLLGPGAALRATVPSVVIAACIGFSTVMTGGQLDWTVTLGALVTLVAAMSLVIDWRSVVFTALTLMPPVAGGMLMYGLLAIFDVDLNPANLIVLPLILGIGVDDGVHVVHDFRTRHSHYRMAASTMNAIILTSLTSMIGFGSMMIAAHRGLYSLGLVLVIGVGSCLFISLVPLPALLTLFDREPNEARD